VSNKRKRLERIRILDLGCGSGDAYDLIMGITTKDPGIYDYITAALTEERLKKYLGVDINEDLLRQAEDYYGKNPKMHFIKGNISGGLPDPVIAEEPFDLYFSSYGTLSHFHDDQNVKLIADIFRHAPPHALFVGDWLGRYSYEWQDLWHHFTTKEYFMDYRISYIYPEEEERNEADVAVFPLRLITQEEITEIISQASQEAGVEIKTLKFFDRSLLVGRHMDTGDYNKHCPKLRNQINSLFESYTRTDLVTLKVDYMPRENFDHLNKYFERFVISWNALIDYTIALLSEYDCEKGIFHTTPEILSYYPEPLKKVMNTMHRLVKGVGTLKHGDVRANVIEPQLAYLLRELEMISQPGTGVGHSLTGIFEIIK
jgi:SAM-dependent methyltransferase